MIAIEDNRIYFLFKRGRYDHIKTLYETGEIYINTIDFIRNCDNNRERSDSNDSISFRKYFGQAEITFYDVEQNRDKDADVMRVNAENVVLNNDHEEKGNIYCLTGIYSEELSSNRSEITFNTKSLGEAVILIHNPQKFLDRIFNALKENGYKNFKSGKVFYYANDFSGKVGHFRKHEEFKPQNEFRIFVPNTKNEQIKFNIGPLHDIAVINTELIKLTYSDGKQKVITL